jgi:hypothetical protein
MSPARVAFLIPLLSYLSTPVGLALAQDKPNDAANQNATQVKPGGIDQIGGPAGAPAQPRSAPGERTSTSVVTPQPGGIQITNTLTVSPPAAPPPAPAAQQPATPMQQPMQQMTPGAASPPAPPPVGAVQRRRTRMPEGSPRGTELVRYERKIRTGLTAAGVTMFATSYGLTVIAAAAVGTDCDPGASDLGCTTARWPLFIPVAGPFIQMGYLDGGNQGTARGLLALDGVLQAGGAVMAIVGVIAPKKVAIPVLTAGRFRVAPAGSGLMAMGSF